MSVLREAASCGATGRVPTTLTLLGRRPVTPCLEPYQVGASGGAPKSSEDT
ncbi:MAG: hypothetical protein ACRDVM_08450 [Acidimicrobiia bacterium]